MQRGSGSAKASGPPSPATPQPSSGPQGTASQPPAEASAAPSSPPGLETGAKDEPTSPAGEGVGPEELAMEGEAAEEEAGADASDEQPAKRQRLFEHFSNVLEDSKNEQKMREQVAAARKKALAAQAAARGDRRGSSTGPAPSSSSAGASQLVAQPPAPPLTLKPKHETYFPKSVGFRGTHAGKPPDSIGAYKRVFVVDADDPQGDDILREVCRKFYSGVCSGECSRAHACMRCGELGHGFSECRADKSELRWPSTKELHGPRGFKG